MIATLDRSTLSDLVVTYDLSPGTFSEFIAARQERGPLLKCLKGSVTLVSPGLSHEQMAERVSHLVTAVCAALGVKVKALRSTTQKLQSDSEQTAYEPDLSYYIPGFATAKRGQVPDLAVEIVMSHSEKKALRIAAALGIPELWVLDIPRHKLTFYHLATRGKSKGTYLAKPSSRALPLLKAAEALERLDDPEGDDITFHENCRAWARATLVPRAAARKNGA
jgi:Uma2 family endonuclease